jgi:hypothetical protein
MQERNFILTDVMKTGDHQQLESFINFSDIPGQQFDMTGEWYTLQQYDLKTYTRRIAFIDHIILMIEYGITIIIGRISKTGQNI